METNCFVYFVRNPKTKKIKIGKSIHPTQRIKELQRQEKTKLEALLIIGYNDLESSMHSKFDYLRDSGEWFNPGEDLIDFILSTKASVHEEQKEESKSSNLLFRFVQIVFTFFLFFFFSGVVFFALSEVPSDDRLFAFVVLELLNAFFCPALGTIFAIQSVYESTIGGIDDN